LVVLIVDELTKKVLNSFTHWRKDTLDLHEQERVSIERALERFGGNRRKAAEALKISTVTLWRKMKQYGLSS
jgi:transcriptional regulator with PAS, ATPase and Fis domain